jgi:hypothetical protein
VRTTANLFTKKTEISGRDSDMHITEAKLKKPRVRLTPENLK